MNYVLLFMGVLWVSVTFFRAFALGENMVNFFVPFLLFAVWFKQLLLYQQEACLL